jgi:hypothetical protein
MRAAPVAGKTAFAPPPAPNRAQAAMNRAGAPIPASSFRAQWALTVKPQ